MAGLDARPPRTKLAWLVVCLVGLSWAWALLGHVHVGMDEAQQLAQSWRLTQGDRLYQEAWEFVAPLPLLFMAALFAWTGPSLDLARLVAAGLALATVFLAHRLAQSLGASPMWAAASTALIAWGATPMALIWYHHWWSQAFTLASFVALASALAHPSQRRGWFLSGGLGALAILSTQSQAPVLIGAWAVAWGTQALAQEKGQAWRQAGALSLGAMLPALVAVLYFAVQGGLKAFLLQVWWWPLTHYRLTGSGNEVAPFTDLGAMIFPFGHEAMPYGMWLIKAWASFGMMLLLPMVVMGLGLGAWGACKALLVREHGRERLMAAVGVALLLQLAVVLRGRSDVAHFQMASPLACVVLAFWASQAWAAAGGHWGQRVALRAPGAWLLALLLASGASGAWGIRQAMRAGLWAPGGLDAQLRQAPDLQALRAWVPAGSRLFAFPAWGQAYLLGGMRPATRFMLLTPQSTRYHGPEEYAAFRADWASKPPDAVAILDMPASEAAGRWGGQPDLSAYRLVHSGLSRMGSGWVPFTLWLRGVGR